MERGCGCVGVWASALPCTQQPRAFVVRALPQGRTGKEGGREVGNIAKKNDPPGDDIIYICDLMTGY